MFIEQLEYKETHDSKKKLGYIYLFFGIPGLILLIIMALLIPGRMDYFQNGTHITGKIVGSRNIMDGPYVKIGQEITFTRKSETDSSAYFTVLHDKDNNYIPGRTYNFYYINNDISTIKSRTMLLWPLLFFAIMGGTFAGCGFIPYLYHFRNRRRNRRYFNEFPWVEIQGRNAEPVVAVITRIKKNYVSRSSMFSPQWKSYYTLECATPDNSRTFESRPFWLDPEGIFSAGDEVFVVVDKSKPGRYIVDVTSLFNKKAKGGVNGLFA